MSDPSNLLTVVMYHYVRPVAAGPYPKLKALEVDDFHGQLDWLARHYTMVNPSQVRAAVLDGASLPERPCLLTFDDGYSDHYDHVFPALQVRGMSGLFFAPSSSLIDRKVLEVNKIQFVLANHPNPDALADEVDAIVTREGFGDVATLRAAHFAPNRYDGAEVAYVKRLLQHALAPKARTFITDALFAAHVSADEAAFAEELYLTPDQAVEMREHGMEFGGHGDLHLWHGECAPEDLAREVAGSARALGMVQAPIEGGFYCYPFGSQSADVRVAVGAAGFGVGFTVEPNLCDVASVDPLQIPRLDTRDLPYDPAAPLSQWLNRVREAKT